MVLAVLLTDDFALHHIINNTFHDQIVKVRDLELVINRNNELAKFLL